MKNHTKMFWLIRFWPRQNHCVLGSINKTDLVQLLGLFEGTTVSFIIFWDFLMFYQIFLPSQVKRCAIITYRHGIYELPYELPHELPHNLRLRILGNKEISGNWLNFI